MITFEKTFFTWLNHALINNQLPKEAKAFCFNLSYPAGYDDVKYDIELIGAEKFLPDNEDWACEEIWEPSQRRLLIPTEYSTDACEICQKKMKQLIKNFIDSDNPAARILKERDAVAIGFVDGHLDLIWVKTYTKEQ